LHYILHLQYIINYKTNFKKNVLKITSRLLTFLFLVLMTSTFFSCEGPVGPIGPAGAAGANGTNGANGANGAAGANGTNGTNGTDATVAIPTQADIDAYLAANGVIGARLYDHPVNEALDQAGHDAVWGSDAALYSSSADFYRCKSCHGWDLKGQRGGALIGKAPSANYPVASSVNLYQWARVNNIKTVYNGVKNVGGHAISVAAKGNSMPDFTQLGEANIWNLVKFLKETSHDMNDFYAETVSGSYPTGTKVRSDLGRGGDPIAGAATYQAKCAMCHGTDGTAIDIYCQGIYLGDMFRADPHEIQHKAIWGMPTDRVHITASCAPLLDGKMPSITINDQDIRNMMVAGLSVSAFPGH
jgi:cytochrome c